MATRNAWVLLLGGGVLFASGFWGCGDDEETATAAVTGTGGGGAAGPVTGSGTMSMSASTGSAATPDIGLPCTTDANCQMGDPSFKCLKASDSSVVFGGGPPNGYCTKDCTNDSECPVGSNCITNDSGQGECYLECTMGPELMFIDDDIPTTKCHQRMDTACRTLNAGTVCVPVCGQDAQCGGRVCDPRTALCQDTANPGTPHGALCNVDAENEDGCAGHCQGFEVDNMPPTDYAICTTLCSLGGKPFDGQADCGGFDNGVCLFRAGGSGAGDWGACSPTCTAHDQCGNGPGEPHMYCRILGVSEPGQGFCYFVTECPNGNECNSLDPPPIMGYAWQCTDTAGGPVCLEIDTANGNQLVFPLQGTSTGSGGSGGTPGTGGTGGTGGN
jgi:hypothetical protein